VDHLACGAGLFVSLQAAVDGTVQDAAPFPHNDGLPDGQDDGKRKLIDKLATAEQLKAGFLLRVLQQGQFDLFELAFARLLQLNDTQMRRTLYESGPRPVAMACHAAGIDRCVFPTVYHLSRQGRRMAASLQPEERDDVQAVFETYSRAEALARLRAC
jgi:uncharacterized protein (DUF2336 family)